MKLSYNAAGSCEADGLRLQMSEACTCTACDQAAMTAAMQAGAGEVVCSQVEAGAHVPYR